MLTIIRRELLNRLQSSQFAVLLALATVVFVANGLVFSKRYEQHLVWYQHAVARIQQSPSTMSTTLYVKPAQLAFVSEGGEAYTPAAYGLKPKGVLSSSPNEPCNYKVPEVPEMDWSFIVMILFSLYVLLLGYDAVCGEREQGTLRLTLSYPLGRLKLLAAKYCAILSAVLVPLAVGVLVSLVVMWTAVPTILTAANAARMGLVLVFALAYLSAFALMSLLISSVIRQSSVALLALLVVWLLFAVLVPNAAGILSEGFSDVPSEYQMAKQVGPMIQQQVWGRIEKVRERAKNHTLTTEAEVLREAEAAFTEGQQDLVKHYDSYRSAMEQRGALARALSRLSPAALFQYACESAAGTGVNREDAFLRDAREYSRTYDAYILGKVGKLVAVSDWSFSGDVELDGKEIRISSPQPEEYKGDKSDFPQFHESKPSLMDGIHSALPDLLGLLLWNLLLGAAAFWAILRADVR